MHREVTSVCEERADRQESLHLAQQTVSSNGNETTAMRVKSKARVGGHYNISNLYKIPLKLPFTCYGKTSATNSSKKLCRELLMNFHLVGLRRQVVQNSLDECLSIAKIVRIFLTVDIEVK